MFSPVPARALRRGESRSACILLTPPLHHHHGEAWFLNVLSLSAAKATWTRQWHGLLRLRQDGVPVLGFTWYSLTDQLDWDTALREVAGRVNSVGLYDLERRVRPVGRLYRRLVQEWGRYLNHGTTQPRRYARAA